MNIMNYLQKHLSTCLLATAALLGGASPAFAGHAVAPPLGTTASYTLLGTNSVPTVGTVTCTGSTITGDVGTTFGTPPFITNTGCTITGAIVAPVPAAVVTDFGSAYSALNALNPACDGVIPIVSTTLPPGVYCSAAATTIGAGVILTLSGPPSGIWVFRIGTGGLGALTLTSAQVVMAGGGQACNVFWGTAEAATMTDSDFVGTVLSGTAVTVTRGTYVGRAMATTDVTVTNASGAPAVVTGCAAAGGGAVAAANLLQAIKVGGGWVSVVSYVNTHTAPAGGTVFIHATHQSKNSNNLLDACVHVDGRSVTTQNDLTTSVLSITGGGAGGLFPAGDTIGGTLLSPTAIAAPVSEGFLVLENYDSAGTAVADGTLTSEAIVFNLASGFLYSERALTVTRTAASPAGVVTIDAPACGTCNYLSATPTSAGATTLPFSNATAGNVSRFLFLPPATATAGAYVIALNRTGTLELTESGTTTNLVAPGYNARIRLETRMDASQGYALGVYNRLEDFRSLTQVNDVVCLGQLSSDQLTGSAVPSFIANGGWMNLAPRCREDTGGGAIGTCDSSTTGVEIGDAAILHKVETAPGYGLATTPMHQQWYVK